MDIDQTQDCCFTHEENWFRYRVGAIILEENSVLVATNDACDFYYSIGGGVHLGETAEEAGAGGNRIALRDRPAGLCPRKLF